MPVELSGSRVDAALALTDPRGESATIILEAKGQPLEARVVSSLLHQWQGLLDTGTEAVDTDGPRCFMVISPFIGPSAIGPSAKERLADAGISCADATGNLRLVASRPAVFIETEGAVRNPWRENVPLPSLQGRRSGRVVRAFLDHRPPYGTRELAALSDNAPSSNSRMTEWWTARSMAAAVAMGLAKVRSHYEKTRLDVISNDLRSQRSAMRVKGASFLHNGWVIRSAILERGALLSRSRFTRWSHATRTPQSREP